MMRRVLPIVAILALSAGALAQEAEPPPSPFARARRAQPAQVAEPAPAEATEAAPEAAPAEAHVEPVLAPAPEQAEATSAPAIEPAAAGELPEDPAAEAALDQALQDGFAEDLVEEAAGHELPALGASEAHAQEAPGAYEGASEHGEAHPAAAPHGEEAHGEAHGPNYPAMIVNFLVWAAIIVWLLRKPLSEYLKNRRLAVIEGLEESKRLKAEAEAKHAEYSERLAHLDEELAQLRKEMVQAGEAERDRIIAEAEARAARMRRDAQFVIDQQMKQLKADLTREAVEAAVKAAEEVLTAQTGTADQERLAQAYLGELGSSMKKGEVQA